MSEINSFFNTPIEEIYRASGKRAELVKKLGLYTVRDAMFFLPRDYKDFSVLTPVVALTEGEHCALLRISSEVRLSFIRKNLTIVSVQGNDETGGIKIVWYNQTYRKNQIEVGRVYLICGKVTFRNGRPCFENPDIEAVDNIGEGEVNPRGIIPVYPLTAGLGQKTLRGITRACLDVCDYEIEETFPDEILSSYNLMPLIDALNEVHYPTSPEDLIEARRRIGIEEAVAFLLAIEMLNTERKKSEGIAFETDGLMEEFLSKLPFSATEAQMEVLKHIEHDMHLRAPMNRLVQGDVGSGKTILALYSLFVAARNGYQGVLMAPTEILAKQHYDNAYKIFGDEFAIDLLLGGMTPKKRREAYERLSKGETDIVIGTHALIQDDVKYKKLGVVIADEQHRFGVRQRAALGKDSKSDVLIMSATPIPRTLTLILYGDLDVSVMKGLPPGREPAQTGRVSPDRRGDMYSYIHGYALHAGQVYVVCPLVEASDEIDAKSAEEIFEELSNNLYYDVPMALLHGRMSSDQKTKILNDFRDGKTRVLVSTTVIEVGVDVPNANVMVVENADRFGLAQLHQLRGRVGRGLNKSWCFLVNGSNSATAAERLKILCESNDGFEIAQKDLENRGPGDYLGTRQSGSSAFKALRHIQNVEGLNHAREIAHYINSDECDPLIQSKLMQYAYEAYVNKWHDIALN